MAKTERLQIRISTDLQAQLRELAAMENRSVSNLVESILLSYIKSKAK